MDVKKYIYLKENFIDDVSYNKFFKWVKNDLPYTKATLVTDEKNKTFVDETRRKVQECPINNFPVSEFSMNSLTSVAWYNFFVNRFGSMAYDFYNKYNIKEQHYDADIDMQILKYEKTNFYIPHYDYHKTAPRHWSFSYIINDNYKGGEFLFTLHNDENVLIEAKANTCIMFPSNFMYPHTVKEVTDGVRYALVGWMK